ncbi:UDP-N-acetylmuramate dehydrogenase [Flavobacteriaceae bacterium]|nr:UDP-N-acetylmuramate dehydrogenase [Flavobacteriaceae bacterium]
MNIQQNISLKPYNTFGIDVSASRFVSVDNLDKLQKILTQEKDVFLLSGGSNMLLTKDIDKLVIHINIKGISIHYENESEVELSVNAGEDWHEFVMWCISQNYGGIENLSLIPGNVGTSPIQNIGAYGVEVKDVITRVEGIDLNNAKKIQFSNKECDFGYRNSIFKNELKEKIVITSVRFKLTKKNHHLNTNYGAIEKELAIRKISNPTIKDISDIVINIRQAKLPDPKKIGNSGSFFKNPIISLKQFKKLQEKYPNIPFYKIPSSKKEDAAYNYKIPAGWLIETAGFKGKRYGDCGIHENQALVLVNFDKASGKDIYMLAKNIQETILSIFEITLDIEVNIIE